MGQGGLRRMAVTVLVAAAGIGGVAAVPVVAAPARPAKAVVVAAAPATAVWSQPVRLTAAVTPRGGGAPQGGTVTFLDGATPVGQVVATTRNTTFVTSGLGPGEHTIRARYEGDAATAPTTSAPITVAVVRAATTVTVASASGPVVAGETAELRAVVAASAPASSLRRPTGTVTFARGAARATVRLNANGVATWRPRLPVGTHPITATYDGSATHDPSTAATVEQEVARASTVDQASTGPRVGEASIADDAESSLWVGQVFDAGRTGLLDAVGLDLVRSGDPASSLIVTIRPAPGGIIGDEVLGTGTLPLSAIPTTRTGELIDVDLSVPAAVTAGRRYAVVVQLSYGPARTALVWPGTTAADGHPGAMVGADWRDWYYVWTADLVFRTWVRPA